MARASSRITADRPALRVDAQHNRDRILDVARETFAAKGLDVPMAVIARRAGVGAATLYRRFPTKESLITEVFAEQLTDCAAIVEDALDDPDPWHGFCDALTRLCLAHAVDRGFTAAFLTAFPTAVEFERERARAVGSFDELVRRAKAAGALRADFTQADLVLLLMANSGVTGCAPEHAVAASRRLVSYLLQAFRAGGAAPLPAPPPLNLDQLGLPGTG